MDYVIEIQGFRDANKEFLPKEVAVVTVDNTYSAHWMVEAPYPFSDLHERERTVNNYVTCYHHGIDWFEGDISLRKLYRNLQEIASSAYRIITRGHEKARFLEVVTSRRIINLELSGCPAFDKLSLTKEYCLFHGVKKEEFYACALNNAIKLRKWLRTSKILTEYDYPAHVQSISGRCPLHHNQAATTTTGLNKNRNIERTESSRGQQQQQQQQQQPPALPERNFSRETSSPLPTPPRTPTKPPRRVKDASTSTTTVHVESGSSEVLDLSSTSVTYSRAESPIYGMTVSESERDEQPTDSGCVINPILEQHKSGFPSRSGTPGMDAPVSRRLEYR